MCDFSQYGGASEEWLEFEKTLPSRTFDLSLDPNDLKRIVNEGREQKAAAIMDGSLASKVRIQDHSILARDGSTIEARSYRPVSKGAGEILPVYLHFHGGGFVFGTIKAEDATCASIASNIEVVVVHVNYRHTPEYTFPTAWHDSQDAFAWLHENITVVGGDASKIVVGGISAGGQLTASLVLEKHLGKVSTGLPPIAGQILMIPCLSHPDSYAKGPLKMMKSPRVSSYVENDDAPLLPRRTVDFFMNLLKTGTPEVRDTKLNPVNATLDEVKGMPPTVFGIAGLDPLRDEGLLYAKLLTEVGAATDINLFKGVPHGYRGAAPHLEASKAWDEVLQQGILWTLSKPKVTGKFEVTVK